MRNYQPRLNELEADILRAIRHAIAWAASIRPGLPLPCAHDEAARRGYQHGMLRAVFISVACEAMPRMIVDERGIVQGIAPKTPGWYASAP